jgi:hypothetical protein
VLVLVEFVKDQRLLGLLPIGRLLVARLPAIARALRGGRRLVGNKSMRPAVHAIALAGYF